MRVPGNERAFTVSPPEEFHFLSSFAQGRPRANHRPFRYQPGRGPPPRAPGIGRRAPRRRRALLYAAGVESRRPPRAPRAPASVRTPAQARELRGAPPRRRPRPCCAAVGHGCSARRRRWRPRSRTEEVAGGPGGLGLRAAPGAAQPGDQREGDVPRTPEIERLPRGARDRSPRAAPAPTRAPRAEAPLPRRGCDGGPRARPQGPAGSGAALMILMRPDGSRSPQHGFCVFSFLSWLISFNWCFRRVWAAAELRSAPRSGSGCLAASRGVSRLEKPPKNLRLERKLKASAGLAPDPRSAAHLRAARKPLAGPGSSEPRTHPRRPGNGPATLPAPARGPGAEPTPALRAGGNFPLRRAPPAFARSLGGPAPAHCPRPQGSLPPLRGSLTSRLDAPTEPVPTCPTEP